MARYEVRGAHSHHTGVLTRAFVNTLRASFLEEAVVGHIYGVGYVAGDIEERVALAARSHSGLRLLKTDGVGVQGIMEDLLYSTSLNNSAGIHYNDIVCHLSDDTQVVGNQHNSILRERVR